MATVLEIVDTAVKIGLGAAISGLSTYLVSANSFKQTLVKSRLEAKGALVKESILKYEEAIGCLNEITHGILVHGIESVDVNKAKELSEFTIQAKLCINHAQSCARLAGLTKLGNCYGKYSAHITELEHLLTDNGKPDLDRTAEIFDEFGKLWREIQPLMSAAYDAIYL